MINLASQDPYGISYYDLNGQEIRNGDVVVGAGCNEQCVFYWMCGFMTSDGKSLYAYGGDYEPKGKINVVVVRNVLESL